jgi:hypothetical protein
MKVGCCTIFAAVIGVLFGFIALRVQQAGGPDQAFYELLPYVPAEVFGAVGSVAVRVITCEGRPVIDQFRSIGVLDPSLQCEFPGAPRPFRVAVSTVKGGSIMYARLSAEVAFRCGYCLGYGFRPNGHWPPPEETVPSYNSDAMLAIALVKGWRQYAKSQASKENIRCGLVAREPLARLASMYMYFRAAGEYWLRPVAEKLKSFSDLDESIGYMWDTMGEDTMVDTHKYLTDSLEAGCERIPFEAFTEGKPLSFNTTATRVFEAWNVNPQVHGQLLGYMQKLDLSRKTEAELKSDHHHTASKFPPGTHCCSVTRATNCCSLRHLSSLCSSDFVLCRL